jgi:hypothetical protein
LDGIATTHLLLIQMGSWIFVKAILIIAASWIRMLISLKILPERLAGTPAARHSGRPEGLVLQSGVAANNLNQSGECSV